MDSPAKNKGFEDYLEGLDLHDNPYPKNSFEFHEWLDGWAIGGDYKDGEKYQPQNCRACGDPLSLPNLILKWDVCDRCFFYEAGRIVLLE